MSTRMTPGLGVSSRKAEVEEDGGRSDFWGRKSGVCLGHVEF